MAATWNVIRKAWSPPALRAYGTVLFWLFWTVILVSTAFYYLPTFIGWRRHVPNLGSVAVVNILLGWLIIPWVVALAMAMRTVPPAVVPVALTRPPEAGPPALLP
jgi:hypothetical protein